jgi:DNA-binding SARP family transcriptional activator
VTEGISSHWYNEILPMDIPLLILHPNLANQHTLLPSALTQPGKNLFFFTIPSSATSLHDLWPLLTQAVSEQTGQTLSALNTKGNIEQAAQQFLKAFQPLGEFRFIIDAVDWASKDTSAWIASLVNSMPAKSQIILSSRQLPHDLVTDKNLAGKLKLYPLDTDRMLLDYSAQPTDRALLEVYGLGLGHAAINGRRIDRWDGALPRSLFFYFIDRGMVTRDEIFHTFWPDLATREATNVFHVTKRKISEILGFDLTVYWSGFYRISPEIDLHYDVVKFGEDVQNSVVANDPDGTNLLERAIYLYRGLFLNTLDMEWANTRRAELHLTYADALSSLGKLRQQQGDTQTALGLYLRAATTQPHREDLARGIMSLYAGLGYQRKAIDVYNRLTIELKRKLGVAPDRQTSDLADQIRQR